MACDGGFSCHRYVIGPGRYRLHPRRFRLKPTIGSDPGDSFTPILLGFLFTWEKHLMVFLGN
jgi:hypothetical protein